MHSFPDHYSRRYVVRPAKIGSLARQNSLHHVVWPANAWWFVISTWLFCRCSRVPLKFTLQSNARVHCREWVPEYGLNIWFKYMEEHICLMVLYANEATLLNEFTVWTLLTLNHWVPHILSPQHYFLWSQRSPSVGRWLCSCRSKRCGRCTLSGNVSDCISYMKS